MRRVETVRNNSRGRFVEKLDTDHSIDPRPQDDVRGDTHPPAGFLKKVRVVNRAAFLVR